MLFSLKPLAVAALAGVRWELKHNWETQDELNKEQAGGWRSPLPPPHATSCAHAEPFDPCPGHGDVAAWAQARDVCWAEAVVICGGSGSTLYPRFHKHC